MRRNGTVYQLLHLLIRTFCSAFIMSGLIFGHTHWLNKDLWDSRLWFSWAFDLILIWVALTILFMPYNGSTERRESNGLDHSK